MGTATATEALRAELLKRCKRSNRGQTENTLDNTQVMETIAKFEQMGDGGQQSSDILNGEWQLAWAGDDVTRSSPFFWAFRQTVPTFSNQIFSITDNLPEFLKQIGQATQIIQNAEGPGEGTLTSRVTMDILPDSKLLKGVVITTCAITSRAGKSLELKIQDTRVRECTLPFWNVTLPFPSGPVLDLIRQGNATVTLETVYCDEQLRISRVPTGQYFVYTRV
jgi:hypothetical protein